MTTASTSAITEVPRSVTPPGHTTFGARGPLVAPSFSAFRPKEVKANAHSVVWSCDGRRLATCGYEKYVRLWSPERTLEERSTTTLSGGFSSTVDSVACHPRHPDLLCAVASGDSKICFWDVRKKSATQTIDYRGDVIHLEYSSDGKLLLILQRGASGEGKNDPISFLDVESRTPLDRGIGGNNPGYGSIYHASFNNVGDIVFLAGGDGYITLAEYPSLSLLERIGSHVRACTSLDFDPRGRYLATGGEDALVNLYDTSEWMCIRTISSADAPVSAVAFSGDGEYIASGNEGHTIDITATETGQHMHRYQVPGTATSMAWHPNLTQHVLASAGGERKGTGWISLFGA